MNPLFNQLAYLNRVRSEMDRLFDQAFRQVPAENGSFNAAGYPLLNVWEDANNLYLEAELPGQKLEDLDITLKGSELTLAGERKLFTGEQEVVNHRRERGVGKFHRFVRLPVPVDGDKVEAKLVHGVLTLVLPKAEAARARKIEVKSA